MRHVMRNLNTVSYNNTQCIPDLWLGQKLVIVSFLHIGSARHKLNIDHVEHKWPINFINDAPIVK